MTAWKRGSVRTGTSGDLAEHHRPGRLSSVFSSSLPLPSRRHRGVPLRLRVSLPATYRIFLCSSAPPFSVPRAHTYTRVCVVLLGDLGVYIITYFFTYIESLFTLFTYLCFYWISAFSGVHKTCNISVYSVYTPCKQLYGCLHHSPNTLITLFRTLSVPHMGNLAVIRQCANTGKGST